MNITDSAQEPLARYDDLVQVCIARVLSGNDAADNFYGIMRYHLGLADEQLRPLVAPRGKGLRGALLLLIAETCGGDAQEAAPLAAAIELLHNFSLIHDDIEDGSSMRRHRPAVWSVWGAPRGINVGDGMYALAHLALHDTPLRTQDPLRFIEIMRGFDAACVRLCEGQHLDMTFEQTPDVSVAAYLRMISGKSAALIATAASFGAYAAGLSDHSTRQVYRFGHELGMAFQMQDDILGIWGQEETTGKSASSDIASRKKTLPILLGLEQSSPEGAARLRALYARRGTHEQPDDTAEVMAILDAAAARIHAAEYLRRYWSNATTALEQSAIAPEKQEQLRRFGRLFIERVA